jgi:hypothetical protein
MCSSHWLCAGSVSQSVLRFLLSVCVALPSVARASRSQKKDPVSQERGRNETKHAKIHYLSNAAIMAMTSSSGFFSICGSVSSPKHPAFVPAFALKIKNKNIDAAIKRDAGIWSA